MPNNVSDVWSCDCPVCRLIVHPILRILLKKTASNESISESEAEEVQEEEIVPTTEGEQEEQSNILEKYKDLIEKVPIQPQQTQEAVQATPQPQQSQQSQTATAGGVGGGGTQTEQVPVQQVALPKEAMERIERLEYEIDKIKKYVRMSIEALKATLVDLRASIAEMSNPFNILRKYADLLFESGEEGASRLVLLRQAMSEQGARAPPQQEEQKEQVPAYNLSTYVSLLRWANSMLDKMSEEEILAIIDDYAAANMITKEEGEALKAVIRTAKRLRDAGLSANEQIKTMRALFKMLKGEPVTDIDIGEEEISTTESSDKESGALELLKMIQGGE